MHPVFLKIGSFELASYGLMTALGYAAAACYLLPRLKKTNLDKDTFWNLIFIAFVGALLGSKLLYIVVSWPQLGETLAEKITNIVRDFRYGFVFFGGMIAAVGALLYYMKKKGLPILKTSDFLIVGLPLGPALRRIGCFLAGCDPNAVGRGVYRSAFLGGAQPAGGAPASDAALRGRGQYTAFFTAAFFVQKGP